MGMGRRGIVIEDWSRDPVGNEQLNTLKGIEQPLPRTSNPWPHFASL